MTNLPTLYNVCSVAAKITETTGKNFIDFIDRGDYRFTELDLQRYLTWYGWICAVLPMKMNYYSINNLVNVHYNLLKVKSYIIINDENCTPGTLAVIYCDNGVIFDPLSVIRKQIDEYDIVKFVPIEKII